MKEKVFLVLILFVLLIPLLFIPSGEVVPAARNAYFLHEIPDIVPTAPKAYGLVISLGALTVSVIIILFSDRQLGLRFTVAGTAAALICSRIMFCLVNLNIYMPEMGGYLSFFRIWDGGLSFFGALVGLISVTELFKKHPGIYRLCSVLSIGLPLLLFAVRLAEEWSGAGFGMSVEWSNFLTIAGRFSSKLNVRRIEMLCALSVPLLASLYEKKTHCSGPEKLAVCCFMIGAMQILLESLRYDRHMIWGFVKAEQITALLSSVFAMLYLLHGRRKDQFFAVMIGIIVAAGVFALEKALDRSSVSSWVLYGVFILLIIAYAWVSIYQLRCRSKQHKASVVGVS